MYFCTYVYPSNCVYTYIGVYIYICMHLCIYVCLCICARNHMFFKAVKTVGVRIAVPLLMGQSMGLLPANQSADALRE